MTPRNGQPAASYDGRLTLLTGQTQRRCPNCQWEMLRDGKSGVEIDHCPLCHGVWLDKDELDTIIARTNDDCRAHLTARNR